MGGALHHGAHTVHVALDHVPVQALPGGGAAFHVDQVTVCERAQGGQAQCLAHDVRGEVPLGPRGHGGQTHAVDRERTAVGQVRDERPRGHVQPGGILRQPFHAFHGGLGFDDSGEH